MGTANRMTLAEIDQIIEENERDAKKCDEDNYHKLQYSNPYARNRRTLRSLRYFISVGENWKWHGDCQGQIIIDNRFIFALGSYKWRREGRSTWYNSKGPKHFLDTYVFKDRIYE